MPHESLKGTGGLRGEHVGNTLGGRTVECAMKMVTG